MHYVWYALLRSRPSMHLLEFARFVYFTYTYVYSVNTMMCCRALFMGLLCVYPFRPCKKSLFVPFTVNDDGIDVSLSIRETGWLQSVVWVRWMALNVSHVLGVLSLLPNRVTYFHSTRTYWCILVYRSYHAHVINRWMYSSYYKNTL